MTDETATQVGLTLVFLAFAGLMALLQRVERSPAIRLWTVAFFLFALDALLSALRSAYDLPAVTRCLAWLSMAAGALTGLIGTLKFLGKRLSYGIYALGGFVLVALLAGGLLGVDVDVLRPLVFSVIGITFVWAGLLAFRAGKSGGAGRWVASLGFIAAGCYALAWPLLRQSKFFAHMEFFLDVMVLLWAANGVLLMHFDHARDRVRALAAQQLALREQLAQAERLDALGRLAAGVAHDFNNVLTIVINGTELVLREIEDRPKAVAQLRSVAQAAQGAVGFTRQLLALGRRRLPGRKSVLMSDALDAAMSLLRPSLSPNITLNVASEGEGFAVDAAEGQIEQLLVNLSLNAADAMPSGGTLSVRIEPCPSDASRLRIVVEDEGVGMDEQTRSRIFDPFFTTKEAQGGTGLGLAAAYAIVQQLGGDISVSSSPGRGTQFTIELPACRLSPEPRAPSSQIDASQVRVLVVDDQEQLTATLTEGLREAGFVADGAGNAPEALAWALDHPPDVLLTDVRMPGVQGVQLAKQMRQWHPRLRVILMTGVAQEPGDDLHAPQALWLLKPFSLDELTRAIGTVLGQPVDKRSPAATQGEAAAGK